MHVTVRPAPHNWPFARTGQWCCRNSSERALASGIARLSRQQIDLDLLSMATDPRELDCR